MGVRSFEDKNIFTLVFAGGDAEAVGDIGGQGLRAAAGDLGLEAAQVLAVIKGHDRHGIGVGDDVPEGQRVRVGRIRYEREDFDFGERITAVEPEFEGRQDAIGLQAQMERAVGVEDVDGLGLEPGGEINRIAGGQKQQQQKQEPVFFHDKGCNMARAARVELGVQTPPGASGL